jgi:hypothetical protein
VEVVRVMEIKASSAVLWMVEGVRGIGNKREKTGVRDGGRDERYRE